MGFVFGVLLGGVGGVAWANNKLYVTDANRVGFTPINNRVLIFDTTQFPKLTDTFDPGLGVRCPVCIGTASVVIGQPDFAGTQIALTATGLRVPTAVATDGTHVAVADTGNNRVLIWNSIPTTNGQPASKTATSIW